MILSYSIDYSDYPVGMKKIISIDRVTVLAIAIPMTTVVQGKQME
ncbi:MAG: hypothetical protein WA364_25945 [Candidatus Nitrosopolaris sp.]